MMRAILLSTSLALALATGGCQQQADKAPEAKPAEAPKKSLARQRTMYQGQEQILRIESGHVEVASNPQNLNLTVKGEVPSAGYTRAGFLPRIYPAAPPDGIYEVDVVADRPAEAAAQVVTPIEVKGEWAGYPQDRLKGVKFIAQNNEVTVMLPAAQ